MRPIEMDGIKKSLWKYTSYRERKRGRRRVSVSFSAPSPISSPPLPRTENLHDSAIF